MCSWKRRDARLVLNVARRSLHLPHVSGFLFTTWRIDRGSLAVKWQRVPESIADVVESEHASVSADAALEMMILMHLQGAVPAKVYDRIPWATPIATSLLRMQINGRDEG